MKHLITCAVSVIALGVALPAFAADCISPTPPQCSPNESLAKCQVKKDAYQQALTDYNSCEVQAAIPYQTQACQDKYATANGTVAYTGGPDMGGCTITCNDGYYLTSSNSCALKAVTQSPIDTPFMPPTVPMPVVMPPASPVVTPAPVKAVTKPQGVSLTPVEPTTSPVVKEGEQIGQYEVQNGTPVHKTFWQKVRDFFAALNPFNWLRHA